MKVFRITKKKYAKDLSGKGAELFGGRWNPIGTPALYTSENRALAILELLAHTPKKVVPEKYVLLELEISAKIEKQILRINKLQKGWNDLQVNDWTQQLGLKYFNEKNILGIQVPSTIIPLEKNMVLNPLHQSYAFIKTVKSGEFEIDIRLLI